MIKLISNTILPIFILFILIYATCKKINVYEEFVEGAKDGFNVAISIIPYLVALIVAFSIFRASGAMEILSNLLNPLFTKLNIPTETLPIMITRPLSGSAALGIFSELATEHGADSYIAKLSAIMLGSSETTFYVLTVYFGAIGIKKFRYAMLTGILADIFSFVLAVLVANLFFLPNIG